MLHVTNVGELRRLAALWHLAARSRHSLVHVPLRTDHAALGRSAGWWPRTRAVDVVLVQQTLQFPPSQWKQVRARLGSGSTSHADSGVDQAAEFQHRLVARRKAYISSMRTAGA